MSEEKKTRTRKPKQPEWPKYCCGVCDNSSMDGVQLKCYVDPPKGYFNPELAEPVQWYRGAPVEATDKVCGNFKPKEMA